MLQFWPAKMSSAPEGRENKNLTLAFVRSKIRMTVRRLRSVPRRLVVFHLVNGLSILIAVAWFIDISYFTTLVFFVPAVFQFFFLPPFIIGEFCRRRSRFQIASHVCPGCDYSLRGLYDRENRFTTCSECGISWWLPEVRRESPSQSHRWLFATAGLAVLLFAVYLGWSFEIGISIKSLRHLAVFGVMLLVVNMILRRWVNDTVIRSAPVVPLWTGGQDEGICPACAAVRKEAETDANGVTTCSKCAAVWRLAGAGGGLSLLQ